METESLAAALEREHREIDAGIEAFLSGTGEYRTDSLVRAMDGLRRHIYLEEEFLFPPLRAGGLMAPVFVMLREHGELWRTLDTLANDLDRDAHAAPETCDELLAQLERHNSKEEPIIYPQADSVLSAEAGDELKAFLSSGQTPAGWVCATART